MDFVLVDTNVVSFLIKGDSRAMGFVAQLSNRQRAISFMTVAELYQWAAVYHWGEQRIAKMEDSLQRFVILPFTMAICRQWGTVRARRRAIGRPISSQDAWIAATALHYAIPLVTHNTSDFEQIQSLEILGPVPPT